jgi:hypothetical protein
MQPHLTSSLSKGRNSPSFEKRGLGGVTGTDFDLVDVLDCNPGGLRAEAGFVDKEGFYWLGIFKVDDEAVALLFKELVEMVNFLWVDAEAISLDVAV